MSPTRITVDEAYRVFQSVLQVKGFAVVDTGPVVKIIPTKDVKGSGLPVEGGNGESESFVTRLVPLRHLEAAQGLAPFIGQQLDGLREVQRAVVGMRGDGEHRVAPVHILVAHAVALRAKHQRQPRCQGTGGKVCEQGARLVCGALDAQGVCVLVQGIDHAVGEGSDGLPVLECTLDDLVAGGLVTDGARAARLRRASG